MRSETVAVSTGSREAVLDITRQCAAFVAGERDGLLHVAGDRHLQLSDAGRHQAVSVMRKHRLAERLLADIIGLDWEDVHIEACRWEHVMSDAVERRIVAMLDRPLVCPHGNPIPGLEDLGLPFATAADDATELISLTAAAQDGAAEVTIDRISEQLQPDAGLMHRLTRASLRPGRRVHVVAAGRDVEVWTDGERTPIEAHVSDHVFVRMG